MEDIDNCQDCGKPTENSGSACAGACASERYYGNFTDDTKGLRTCNCCDKCRDECRNSFMESVEDEEQDFQECANCDGHPACEDFGCAYEHGLGMLVKKPNPMTTVTDLLDRAHTLLAKSALTQAQYDPISELLIQAKAELVAEEMKRKKTR